MLRLEHVACIRACNGVTTVPSIGVFVNVEVLMWRRGGGADAVVHFSPEAGDLGETFPAKILALERGKVNKASISWKEVCFIQFLCCGNCDVHQVIEAFPHSPLPPMVGARHRRCSPVSPSNRHGELDAELTRQEAAPHSQQRTDRLDVKAWPPATNVNGPLVKTPQDRPSEGVFVRALPNTNVSHLRRFEIASKKLVNMKFGTQGTASSFELEVGSIARTSEVSDGGGVDWPKQIHRRRVKAG